MKSKNLLNHDLGINKSKRQNHIGLYACKQMQFIVEQTDTHKCSVIKLKNAILQFPGSLSIVMFFWISFESVIPHIIFIMFLYVL